MRNTAHRGVPRPVRLRIHRPLWIEGRQDACLCAALFLTALFAACGTVRAATPAETALRSAAAPAAPERIVMFLARRRWHIDVGFAVSDLDPSLAFSARRFPQAKYLFFGFGDRHYLLSRHKGTSTLAGALVPGPGLVLVTAIENSPAQAFGASHVLEFALSSAEAQAAQHFVRRTLAGDGDAIAALADGPYEESAYYDALPRYSALHTCNTWAAETMKSAGLKVRTQLTLFAGQTWGQARKIEARAGMTADPQQGVPAH